MEKFIVSARKYRPQLFDTVVGQDHITTTLKNAIKSQQLAHAFLFCGPRGVGKTTCARILAKTINCEQVTPEGEACNVCHSCTSFNEGTSMNIHELDAASNNSVDDIRSLVEQVRFSPQAGRYKVYIIDEVHMLSASAFNAFLKTLEEPPPYAIFILATTEKHKILPTILSRCQIFDFKRITLQDTVDHLAAIAVKENVSAEEAGLQLIAQKSEGCMRDALSILDKIVSFTGGQLTYNNTVEHLNILDADYYFKLADAMLNQDLANAMLLYDDINKKGFEGDMVLNGFAEFLRNVLICKDDRVISLLEVVESFKQRYAETAQKMNAGYIVSALNIISDSEIQYKSARNKRLHVELCIIKLCYLRQALELTANGAALDKKKRVENKPVAFRSITPIAVKSPASKEETKNEIPSKTSLNPAPKLVIDIPSGKETIPAIEVIQVEAPAKPAPKPKLGSLQSLRQKLGEEHGAAPAVNHQALLLPNLKAAWQKFVDLLKDAKNPAWQSFELAELIIKDENSFEATAANNLQQKFLELERNKACEFLQNELHNRKLKLKIVLIESGQTVQHDLPLTSKEQYQKIIEAYPLVKELKDRLRLDLDF